VGARHTTASGRLPTYREVFMSDKAKTLAKAGLVAGAVAAGAVMLSSGTAHADPITTVDNNGILNGNQAVVPVEVPVNVCGNAVAVAGLSGAGCDGGAAANISERGGVAEDLLTTGNGGIGNGNQAKVPVQVPVNACGNAVSAVVGAAGAGCEGGADADQGSGGPVVESDPAADAMAMAGNGDAVTGLVRGLGLPV
jgi:hypothetical protein